jgi:DNA-binding winged helix-turn-helix (wHTH) protein
VCNQLRLQLVFLIDEFDGLCRSMSAQGFALLRALRDDYKYRLMYVVATRLELKRLRAEANEIEAFEELIASHTFWIGPYTEAEAQLALRRLETRHQAPLDHQIAAEVLRLSGGHPGLIREVYYLAQQQPANLALVAARHAQVVDECQRIWLSLAPEEQQVMINLNGATPRLITHPHLVEQLRRKGLVNGSPPDAVCVFSPLLADYINRQSPATSTSIYLDYTRHTVWINGYEVTGLTRLEYELLAYLDQRRSQTCSRDELAHHLYPDEAVPGEAGISDTRLDSIIKRLRRKIEPNPHEPRYLVTMHGYGFRLQDKVQPL